MPRIRLLVGLLSLGLGGPLAAQNIQGRPSDYQFLTNVSDVRGLWVNPAGLAVVPEASILGEFTFERTSSDIRVDQFLLGINSRGLGAAYQRNRFPDGTSITTIRLGAGLNLGRTVLGASAAIHRQDGPDGRGYDIGAVYAVNRSIRAGAAVRNLSRPVIRSIEMPITFVGAAQWTGLGGRFEGSWETHAVDDPAVLDFGYDLSHRLGARVALLGPTRPLLLIGIVDLTEGIDIRRLNLGVALGGRTQGVAMGSARWNDASPVLEQFSLGYVASNLLVGNRR